MQLIGLFPFTMLILVIIFYFSCIYFLTKGKRKYVGVLLPCIFAVIATYYYIKSMLLLNSYPPMQEGIYMTFFGVLSILGFIVFGNINYLLK